MTAYPFRPDHADRNVTTHHANRAAFTSQLDVRPRSYEQPLVAVTVTCTTCQRWDRSGPSIDQHEALDQLNCYGWTETRTGSDVWTCPDCTTTQLRDALDTDDQLNEGRRRDNEPAALRLARRAGR